ncbi:MAG: hypothetical protein QNJ65_06855 [Xenococcaceae cyanobacterium MO_234.B1]|nr:hypothetical protein [Xenococcaceae cyanobacterium MO_234.B1]
MFTLFIIKPVPNIYLALFSDSGGDRIKNNSLKSVSVTKFSPQIWHLVLLLHKSLAQQLVKQGISVANCPGDLVRFLAEPTVAEIPVTPTDYYAQASLMLEQQFENDSVLEDLIPAYT